MNNKNEKSPFAICYFCEEGDGNDDEGDDDGDEESEDEDKTDKGKQLFYKDGNAFGKRQSGLPAGQQAGQG